MKVLAVDVGTGTQDILLYDSRLDVENSYKLVLPSPTMIVRERIRRATRSRQALLLEGVMMGGGPCAWAAEDHLKAGLAVYATPEAAQTFNDDLQAVAEMGIVVVGPEEARHLPATVQRIAMKDFDFPLIQATLAGFGVGLDDLAAVAVAVFDHGAAPVGVSDRQFRFDYLDERIRAENRLSAFAYPAERIPAIMTRMQAVARSAADLPARLVVMDTAPAAVLGATFDPALGGAGPFPGSVNPTLSGVDSTLGGSVSQGVMIANVGNFHTLAFRLGPGGIEGVFEHHTGLIDRARLEGLLVALADGGLTHAEVFGSMGHGALVYGAQPLDLAGPGVRLLVTGPRRNLLAGSRLKPVFAVPFGDMMTAGCFGLLAATADCLPDLREPLLASLRSGAGRGTPPWEVL